MSDLSIKIYMQDAALSRMDNKLRKEYIKLRDKYVILFKDSPMKMSAALMAADLVDYQLEQDVVVLDNICKCSGCVKSKSHGNYYPCDNLNRFR